jgi:hypothetical protein
MPLAAVAGIGAIGSIVGGVISAGAAKSASNAQVAAANHATDVQQHMFDLTRGDLMPFTQGGQGQFAAYDATQPFNFNPTEAQLESTPGYQFTKTQGLKAVQNSAAARGLGVSGAAQKGAATFATGLADQTYGNQFDRALTQYTTNTNKLLQGATIGENAAAHTGAFATQTGANIGNNIVGAGNAQAAGQIGVANALTGAIGGVSNNALLYGMLRPGGFGGSGSGGGMAGMYGDPSAGFDTSILAG